MGCTACVLRQRGKCWQRYWGSTWGGSSGVQLPGSCAAGCTVCLYLLAQQPELLGTRGSFYCSSHHYPVGPSCSLRATPI